MIMYLHVHPFSVVAIYYLQPKEKKTTDLFYSRVLYMSAVAHHLVYAKDEISILGPATNHIQQTLPPPLFSLSKE